MPINNIECPLNIRSCVERKKLSYILGFLFGTDIHVGKIVKNILNDLIIIHNAIHNIFLSISNREL